MISATKIAFDPPDGLTVARLSEKARRQAAFALPNVRTGPRGSRTAALALLLLCVSLGSALPSGAVSGSDRAPRSRNPPLPTTYQQACVGESACLPGAHGTIPHYLFRRLHVPSIGSRGACPASRGALVEMPHFPKVALGEGPVRPMFLDGGNLSTGTVDIHRSTNAAGWLGVKTNWYSAPEYQGPIIIRAVQVGGSGTVAFNVGPTIAVLVVPPGRTLNEMGRWRDMPGGTYVKAPGCYAFQVDGATFSNVIVARFVLVN